MAETPPALQALLLDLDGVLRRWPEDSFAVERATGLPAGAIARVAFDADLLLPAVEGRIADEEWRQQVADRLTATFPEADAARAVRLWSEPAGRIDAEVLALARACRRLNPVVLVTNATSRLAHDLERLGVTQEFDRVINSSAVGCAKPRREIYAFALAAAGVPARAALFVDDGEANVRAAVELGMVGHRYREVADLREALVQHGLLEEHQRTPIERSLA